MAVTVRVVLSILAVATLLAGCAHVQGRAECAAHGGRPWREIQTAHFLLSTDLEPPAARATARELERMRASILLAWPEPADPPLRIDVVALKNREHLREFAGRDVAWSIARDEDGLLLLVAGGYAFDGSWSFRELQHQLVHYLNRYAMLRQPPWVEEGFATYLETVAPFGLVEVRIGAAPPHVLQWLATERRVPLTTLWQWQPDTFWKRDLTARHVTSWLWIHFLMERHREELAEFVKRLGRAEDPVVAWETAFARWQVDGLERELDAYALGVGNAMRLLPLPEPSLDVGERDLTDGEVHTIRARLHAVRARDEADRAARIAREIAAAPERERNAFPLRLALARSTSSPDRLRLARELARDFPERAEPWVLVAEALSHDDETAAERQAAAERAVALAPDNAIALCALAREYHESGTPHRGLPVAARAAQLRPWDAEILATLADLLAGAGRCAQALSIQAAAHEILREAPLALRTRLGARLESLRRACAAR
jgi:hypothetical protein